MLIYPNYPADQDELEKKVYAQIADKHCYYGSPSLDYKYDTDFTTRQTDYFQEKSIKLSHIDSDCASKNFQKQNTHLKRILGYTRPFTKGDRIVLTTDVEWTSVYIYQASVSQGENEIEVFNFQNDLAIAQLVRTLPQIIEEIRDEQQQWYGERKATRKAAATAEGFYVNAKYKHIISTIDMVKTTVKELKNENSHVTYAMDLVSKE